MPASTLRALPAVPVPLCAACRLCRFHFARPAGCAGSTLRGLTQRLARIGAIMRPHDLPNHKLEFGKSPLYPSALRRVKRTHITTQMKRVQRANGSLAQVWGRPQCGFHIQPPTDSPRKTRQSRYGHTKAHFAAPPTPFSAFPRPFVLRRDRHKETYTPEVNPQSPITAPTIRERTNGDHDPRRNRNGTSRKPFCLALCGKQQA